MKQYCRYCAWMVCGDANYCEKKKRTYSDTTIKSANRCKEFELNPIDALFENPGGYKPKKEKADDGDQFEIACLPPVSDYEDVEDLKRQVKIFMNYAESKRNNYEE